MYLSHFSFLHCQWPTKWAINSQDLPILFCQYVYHNINLFSLHTPLAPGVLKKACLVQQDKGSLILPSTAGMPTLRYTKREVYSFKKKKNHSFEPTDSTEKSFNLYAIPGICIFIDIPQVSLGLCDITGITWWERCFIPKISVRLAFYNSSQLPIADHHISP